MRRVTREFDLKDVSPQKIYNLLIEVFKEAEVDPYLNRRLKMKLITHEITSANPFTAEVKAIHGRKWYIGQEDIHCSIFIREGKTLLKITSTKRYGGRGSRVTAIHEENIKRLYGELQFKLGSVENPHLEVQPLGRLQADLDYSDIQEVIQVGMHEYLDSLQARLNQIGEEISNAFFRYIPQESKAAYQQ